MWGAGECDLSQSGPGGAHKSDPPGGKSARCVAGWGWWSLPVGRRSGIEPASFRRSGLSHLAAEELYSSSKKCGCLSDRTHGRIDREELFRHEALTDRDARSELRQPRRRGWPDAVRVRCRRLPVSLNSDNSVAAYHQVRHQHWGARPDRNGFRQTTSRHSRARWYCSSASRQIAELRGPEVRRSLLSPATANGFAAGYDDVIGGFE